MSSGSEQRGFVFSVVFIIIFSTLLASVPAGFQGSGEDVETVIPIDPNLLTGFSETEDYYPDNYSALGGGLYYYDYDDLGGRDWRSVTDDDTFLSLGAKVYVVGIFFFGTLEYCEFESPSGENLGTTLTFDQIDADDTDSDYAVRYSLTLEDSGDSAGSLVIYWNGTASVGDAWDADDVYLLHGVGIDSTATTNIAALLISLLFIQLPEVPTLINIFIAVPIWACIVFVLWYVVKEMIPFV